MTPILGVTASQISGHLTPTATPYFILYKRQDLLGLSSQGFTSQGADVDSSGNIYELNGYDGITTYLTKYDSLGDVIFELGLDIINNPLYPLVCDAAGNSYIVASVYNQPNWIQLIKYSSTGVLQWTRTLIGVGTYAGGNYVNVDTSGNVYVAAYFWNTSNGGVGLIAKYNSSGALQWQRSISDQNPAAGQSTSCQAIATDSALNVYTTGYYTRTGTAYSFNIFIAKYNSSGVLQWQRFLQDPVTNGQGMQPYSIVVDSSSNVYILSAGNTTSIIAKYNTSGALQWQRSISEFAPRSMTIDSSSNIYLTGISFFDAVTNHVIKYNTSGVLQWQRSLVPSNTLNVNVIKHDTSTNLYISGWFRNTSMGAHSLFGKFPDDGTRTQNIVFPMANINYSTSSLSEAAGNLTSGTSTLVSATSTLTNNTSITVTETSGSGIHERIYI